LVAGAITGYEFCNQKINGGAKLASISKGPMGYVDGDQFAASELRLVMFQSPTQTPVEISVDGGTTSGTATCSVNSVTCSVQSGSPSREA